MYVRVSPIYIAHQKQPPPPHTKSYENNTDILNTYYIVYLCAAPAPAQSCGRRSPYNRAHIYIFNTYYILYIRAAPWPLHDIAITNSIWHILQ